MSVSRDVQVHVLTRRQVVNVVCDATADVVGSRLRPLTSLLSDVTSADVTVDYVHHCESTSG